MHPHPLAAITLQDVDTFEHDGAVCLSGVFGKEWLDYLAVARDCIVFHGLTIHGAPGNPSSQRRRRAISTTRLGDDTTYVERAGLVEPHIEKSSSTATRSIVPIFRKYGREKPNLRRHES